MYAVTNVCVAIVRVDILSVDTRLISNFFLKCINFDIILPCNTVKN